MSWALKRQLFYLLILVLFFSIFGFLILYPSFNKTPTCLDKKMNGDETGVDCGGKCPNACIFQVDKVSVLWARSFKIAEGRYNAVAYLENHNANTAVNKIRYKFRFADENNVYLGTRNGETTVPPGGKFAVLEPAIDVGNSVPVYTTFEFTTVPTWSYISSDKINQLKIIVSDVNLINADTSPVLSAVVKNNSLFSIPAVGVIAILYDIKGNAISASRTYIDMLSGMENAEVNFTWPAPLPATVVTKEIIPVFNIFSVKLK